jgi:hypothetical protein
MYGHADCVQLLLDAGADKEARNEVRVRVVYQYPIVFHSISHFSCCLRFLSLIGGASQNGSTALIYAVQYHHANCVRLLLDAGADLEALDRVRPLVDRCLYVAPLTFWLLFRNTFNLRPPQSCHFYFEKIHWAARINCADVCCFP